MFFQRVNRPKDSHENHKKLIDNVNKRYMRLYQEDKQAHHCNIQRTQRSDIVDAAGIGGRNRA